MHLVITSSLVPFDFDLWTSDGFTRGFRCLKDVLSSLDGFHVDALDAYYIFFITSVLFLERGGFIGFGFILPYFIY